MEFLHNFTMKSFYGVDVGAIGWPLLELERLLIQLSDPTHSDPDLWSSCNQKVNIYAYTLYLTIQVFIFIYIKMNYVDICANIH